MKIAFIGLGNMGAPMAENLAGAGFAVRGFDPIKPQVAGVEICDSAGDAVRDADVVITMLAESGVVREVANAVMPSLNAGALWLECSTVDVQTARDIAALGEAQKITVLDAPVSGGISGAQAGSLTFMVGGAAAEFERAAPLFDVMGNRAVHCGLAGAGQAAKICNNMILGATMIATCEAFVLADRLGLERQKMFDVVSTSSGASWSMNTYCPACGVGPNSPADNDYRPGFAAALMLKDLRLAVQAAEEVGAQTPMGRRALELYNEFVEGEESGGGQDFSAMLLRFEKAKG